MYLHSLQKFTSFFSSPKVIVGLIIALGLALRYFLINSLPVINDEGSYFYDAYLISKGFIPYEDFLTKSTPHIYLIYFFTSLFGNTISAGRIMLLTLFVINGIFLYAIARKLFNTKAALVSLSVFALYPEIAIFTSYTQTQILQLCFGLLFMLYMISMPKMLPVQSVLLALLATIAYITRMTSVVYVGLYFVYLGMLLWNKTLSIKEVIKNIIYFVGAITVVNTIIFTIISPIIGVRKTMDFFGLEMLSQSGVVNTTLVSITSISVSFIQNLSDILQLFSNAPFLLVIILLMIGFTFLRFNRLYLFPILILFSWYFYASYTASSYIYYYKLRTIQVAIELTALFLFLGVVMHDYFNDSKKEFKWQINFNLIPIWLIGLVLLYGFWIKFRAPYFIEFIPVVVLSVGFIYYYWEKTKRHFLNYLLLVVIFISITFSQLRSFSIFYTGSYFPSTIKEVEQVIRKNSDQNDTILTASIIFPFVSERKIVGNISHPYWLGYKDFDQELVKLYMPTLTELEASIKQNPPELVIMDKTTKETYFTLSNSLEPFVKKNYEEIYRNAKVNDDPLVIYKLSR